MEDPPNHMDHHRPTTKVPMSHLQYQNHQSISDHPSKQAFQPHPSATQKHPQPAQSAIRPRPLRHLPPSPGPKRHPKAYGEVSHFLGGLIAHPTESTRHYTILRHSHGIVFYRGSTTSIAISIFSDTPLPADRTYFLQSRGWTGKTGMKAKALFRLTDDWLDVTPSFALRANQVSPGDERAWQRDINKFRKKAPSKLLSHKLRETIVARIPAEAGDGYFQLNLCQSAKKKVLCSSPVFRSSVPR
ncbi:LipA and NB-ARC domain protein [Aspergillus nomiae NRRL 13137]|uniref:LipA and NB-ARC domain protein n=1 Tax=Aspergillus nomiae NRRL (strain ATCC 15546 / NRRL 13137 / CBS 260.88 / M93) TaxID=1509407 RepID=A0A0L1JHU4_ASPN3|nr:LipA and NB-ARC domain protein [Aspergillus nomiae NRRL 13137]KNG91331.1 LipA and NB-ARC domain protein [Aspergillus nomiae NRRL 13137]